MTGHNAAARDWNPRGSDPEWRADCGQCGWVQRAHDGRTEAQAQKAAEAHNVTRAAEDDRLRMRLYGPRPSR